MDFLHEATSLEYEKEDTNVFEVETFRVIIYVYEINETNKSTNTHIIFNSLD